MIRDRIKTEEYFQEAFEWYSESLRKKLERFDKESRLRKGVNI